jgi:AcrR family transcriptional regulator
MIGAVAQRREARVATIVDAAWNLARREGIAGLTLRGLARELGVSQPSLYEYFASKNALYDAMFAEGNRQLLARLDALRLPSNPRRAVKSFVRAFVEFALDDDARAQLLFSRPIPGFEPSPASYAKAQEVLDRMVSLLTADGMTDAGDVDCFIAMVGGVIAAQTSNEPGGNRWVRHLDRLVDLYVDNARPRRTR